MESFSNLHKKKGLLMMFTIGDKVVHPKRPEWGVGIVQPGAPADSWLVDFSTAGRKKLKRDIVILQLWDANQMNAEQKSETKSFSMKKVQPYQPKFFSEEYHYKYPPTYLSDFLKGGIGLEWARKHPELFDENDIEFLDSPAPKLRKFKSWLGAVLLKHHTQWNSLQPSWVFQNQKNKQAVLVESLTLNAIVDLKSFEKQHTFKHMPTLWAFDSVYHRKAMIWVKENGESFSPEEISLIKELVQKHSLPQILIRIEPIAKLHVF